VVECLRPPADAHAATLTVIQPDEVPYQVDANSVVRFVMPVPGSSETAFVARGIANRLATLVGNADGAVHVSQDIKTSRLSADRGTTCTYRPSSSAHGVYAFVIDGNVSINDVAFERRDSLGVWGGEPITVNTDTEGADVLFVETVP
jgi:redox-sensitive bicupin YhaK (pirin superfamily)